MDQQVWLEARRHTPEMLALARKVLEEVRSGRRVADAVRRHPLPQGGYLGKHVLVAAYRQPVQSGAWPGGHPTDKIELLILGGTWSSYRRDYQVWFIQRCFDALNGSESSSLEDAHRRNETAQHRNVGLVVE